MRFACLVLASVLALSPGRLELRAGTAPELRLEGELAAGTRLRWREHTDGLVLVVENRDRLRPTPANLRLVVPPGVPARLELRQATGSLQLPETAEARPDGRVVLGEGVVRCDWPRSAGPSGCSKTPRCSAQAPERFP